VLGLGAGRGGGRSARAHLGLHAGRVPLGEAVAAEPGQVHDVDVLDLGRELQVLDELAERVGLRGHLRRAVRGRRDGRRRGRPDVLRADVRVLGGHAGWGGWGS